jgi:1-deoxy-D-xylulose-5-phosphate synthase
MVETAYRIDDKPSAVRYPRASAYGADILKDAFGTVLVNGELPARGTALAIGKGRVVREARRDVPYRACILSIGTRLLDSVMAARALEASTPDLGVTVADARFMKPLDEALITELARTHDMLVTIEEGSVGGFGDHVLHYLTSEGLLDDGNLRVRSMVIPDIWIEQGPQKDQYDIAELNEPHIVAKVVALLSGLRTKRHQTAATVGKSVPASAAKVFNAPFQQQL